MTNLIYVSVIWVKHREHTLLLNRKRVHVNKEMKRTNSLPTQYL